MKRIHYCKGLLATGKPIIVFDETTHKEKNVKSISGYGKWSMSFNNAIGKEKQRGARVVLLVE